MFPLVKRRMPRKVVWHVDIIELHQVCISTQKSTGEPLTGTVKTVKFVFVYYRNHSIGLLSLIIMTIFEHPKTNCGKLDGGGTVSCMTGHLALASVKQ